MKRLLLPLLIFTLVPGYLWADVVNSSEHGFELHIEKTVNSDAMTVYQQFIRIGKWWDPEHTWFGKAENLSMEPT
jgi:hypothetical protein